MNTHTHTHFVLFIALLTCVYAHPAGVPEANEGKSQCAAMFKGQQLTYGGCDNITADYRVLWNIMNSSIETMFVAKAEGWAGLGWGHSAMVPGDAVIAYKKGDMVEVADFSLTGKWSGGVSPKATQQITDAEAEAQGDNIVARFTRPLTVGGNVLTANSNTNLIYAVGPSSPEAPKLNYHGFSNRGIKVVNLTSAVEDNVEDDTEDDFDLNKLIEDFLSGELNAEL